MNDPSAFFVHNDILGFDELSRGDRALCVDRIPFSFMSLPRHECARAVARTIFPTNRPKSCKSRKK